MYDKYNRYKNQKVIVPAERGIIYDCNGIALAENKRVFKLDLCPAIISWAPNDSVDCKEKQKIYQKIAEITAKYTKKSLSFYIEKIEKFAAKYPNGFELATNLDAATKEAIISDLEINRITGITCYKQPSKRVYPKGELAGSLIGLYSSGKAMCGIAETFNDELTGEDGWVEVIHYGTGKNYHLTDMATQEAMPGNSIYLTIDTHIQTILEKNLREGIKNYQAKNAIGIIISPKNGNILAMSGISAENINASNQFMFIHSMPILPINWLFEPGSTMKPVTALLAIEKGLFKSTDTIDCRTRRIGERVISDVHPYTELTFKDVIAHSSNVGITRVVDKISKENLYNRLTELGFGHKTGITLKGENPGLLRHPSKWSDYSLHSLSFGQEISVTAIQLVYAYAALVNGGELLQPQIVKEIKNSNGKVIYESSKQVVRQISNKESLDTLKTFLQAVVEEGYGKTTKLSYVNIGGKTGTGEKQKEGGPGYDEDKYVSSFVGFFPVEDPQIVMIIIFDEPDYKHRYGSICACPTFKYIAEEVMVTPNLDLLTKIKQINQAYISVPNCIGLPVNKLQDFLSDKKISYSVSGDGNAITNQFPKPGTTMLDKQSVLLIAE